VAIILWLAECKEYFYKETYSVEKSPFGGFRGLEDSGG
jgi:hypothetical protein